MIARPVIAAAQKLHLIKYQEHEADIDTRIMSKTISMSDSHAK